MGRPKNTMEATLLKVKEKMPTEKLKVCGSYKIWFIHLLWIPINVALKRCDNLSDASHYLRATYKKLGECGSVYDHLY